MLTARNGDAGSGWIVHIVFGAQLPTHYFPKCVRFLTFLAPIFLVCPRLIIIADVPLHVLRVYPGTSYKLWPVLEGRCITYTLSLCNTRYLVPGRRYIGNLRPAWMRGITINRTHRRYARYCCIVKQLLKNQTTPTHVPACQWFEQSQRQPA